VPRNTSNDRDQPAGDRLRDYRAKRDFARTPEPVGEAPLPTTVPALAYVIQKHAATRLHYDFRLELDGTMRSWAVPKGPSLDPADKRIAVQVEDHPLSYNSFEGEIPKGQYGAGRVIVWDRGQWRPDADPHQGLAEGKLLFTLFGSKLAGQWELVRIAKPGERQPSWILFKKRDAFARPRGEYDVLSALPDSIVAVPLPIRAAAGVGTDRTAPLPTEPAAARGAVAAPMPATMSPQLATAASVLPRGGRWLYEIKLDGYRILARIESGRARLFTRGGHDWTTKLPQLADELSRLHCRSAWVDGEAVVLGADGLPSFNALQNAFDHRRSGEIVYFAFDLPYLDGHDLRGCPLEDRRALLTTLLRAGGERVRESAVFEADAASLLQSAQRLHLEGLMAKRADAPYVSRRSDTWLKLKTHLRQEFVIAGFTDRGGDTAAAEVGSLVLGVYDAQQRLLPAGSVGTGWNAATAAELKAALAAREIGQTPFAAETLATAARGGSRWSRRNAGQERWVTPELVAEVSFAEWTPEGHVRQARFEGLRLDKPARQVGREVASRAALAAPAAQTRVTHPGRVIDAATGLTKLDLVRYYESVASWLLPHLKGRPCSLVRAPDGVTGELFFQKHLDRLQITGVKELPRELWPRHAPLLEVTSAEAIAAAAQLNVVEFHTWNASVRHIDEPDRVVFDLDPGDGVPWPRVIEGALLVRTLLQELSLDAWVKTSGGKGLHVVVPLAPKLDTAAVKVFARAVVQHLAKVIPDRFVARAGAANRVGRIFVDYLRNSHGATTVAAFSARARPGLGVSMPVSWDTLPSLRGAAQWSIADAREHLSFVTADPWAGYWRSRQTLARAVKKLPPQA